jgi:hypothetical protein
MIGDEMGSTMLTDEQKVFLLELLQQFKAKCPHYEAEPDAHKMMLDQIMELLAQ